MYSSEENGEHFPIPIVRRYVVRVPCGRLCVYLNKSRRARHHESVDNRMRAPVWEWVHCLPALSKLKLRCAWIGRKLPRYICAKIIFQTWKIFDRIDRRIISFGLHPLDARGSVEVLQTYAISILFIYQYAQWNHCNAHHSSHWMNLHVTNK